MNEIPEPNGGLKSFWARPEGKVGAVLAVFLGIGGVALFYRLLPKLIILAENTLHLGILLAVIGALAYMILDPRNRATMFYFYRTVMRWITGLVIQLDPIAILKTYIESLKENLAAMDAQIRKLRGTMATLKRTIDENEKSKSQNMALASQAKKTGNEKIMILKSRKAGRLEESNMTLSALYSKMEVIYRVLSKMYDNCSILLEDTEDQVKLKETEWKAIKQSHAAMRSAMSIINGDKDKRAIYEEALEFIADDLGNKIGEMERFMEMSGSFMDSIDIQNGVFEEKGISMLEKWEKEADSLILGDDKVKLIAQAQNDNEILYVPAATEPMHVPANRSENQFDTLFR